LKAAIRKGEAAEVAEEERRAEALSRKAVAIEDNRVGKNFNQLKGNVGQMFCAGFWW